MTTQAKIWERVAVAEQGLDAHLDILVNDEDIIVRSAVARKI